MERQRNDFLQAEKLIAQDNQPAFVGISKNLTNYPLYPYLQYQWIKDHLGQTGKVLEFLSAYPDTRYAALLRSKWLAYLFSHEQWLDLINNYQPSEDTVLRCQFYWANYKIGNAHEALNEAKNLWLTGASQPEECEPLLSALALSAMLTPDLIWQRFELALKKDNIHLAEYVQRFMDKPGQDIAAFWLQVHKNPYLIQKSDFNLKQSQYLGRIFAHGVGRMAKLDLDLAIALWDAGKKNYSIDNPLAQKLEGKLGMALGLNKDNRAYSRLGSLPGDDAEIREWKVRAALLEQNWHHVADALSGLRLEEQQSPKWQYWQARTLAAMGKNAPEVQALYNKVAEDRSFYGLLAANIVNKSFKLNDKPVVLAANDLAALSRQEDFKVVKELDLLNRKTEAQRQWWFAVKKLPKEKQMIAAKLAQQWHWDQIAIMTLVKADYWDDLALRFPLLYLNHAQESAFRQNLDPAIVLGIIRQESMLDNNARSAVGALGLMQIMPKTGKQIALELNEKWQSENNLLNPDVNIRYGAYYFKKLVDRYNGQVALATAAYNAGPNRVKLWLPKVLPVAADIWIETIPFKETRKYVTSVISYAMIYQHRIRGNLLKIRDLLPDVQPG